MRPSRTDSRVFQKEILESEEYYPIGSLIEEADLVPYFYMYRLGYPTVMVRTADRDLVAIGLLYGHDMHKPDGTWRQQLYIRLANRTTPKNGDLYVHINRLYDLIDEDDELNSGYVQNRVLSAVSVMILCGTDFVKGYAKGLGRVNCIIDTFYSNPAIFSHLFQHSRNLVPDPNILREPVVDERAFFRFTSACYLQKHEKTIAKRKHRENTRRQKQAQRARKRLKKMDSSPSESDSSSYGTSGVDEEEEGVIQITRDELKKHVNKHKNPSYHMMKRNEARLLARRLTWNLLYWFNGYRDPMAFGEGGRFDPLKKGVDGRSYFGFAYDKETEKAVETAFVSAFQDPVLKCYARHMMNSTRKTPQSELTKESLPHDRMPVFSPDQNDEYADISKRTRHSIIQLE